ncbi:MAG: hypothetical protein IK032_08280, partial [Bacteroidales bacterium]|nr:hypothetical protein [Bacteroidales bacterium]
MKSLKISLKIYFLLLAVFFVFRLLLLLVNLDKVEGSPFWDVVTAFLIGVRFDTTTISFIMALPVLLLIITEFVGKMPNFLRVFLVWFLSVVSCVAFLVCAADIPYYNEFVTRFNISAFNEFKSGHTGIVMKMI